MHDREKWEVSDQAGNLGLAMEFPNILSEIPVQ